MGPPPLWRGGCILNVEGHAGVQGRRNEVFLSKHTVKSLVLTRLD